MKQTNKRHVRLGMTNMWNFSYIVGFKYAQHAYDNMSMQ